MNIKDCEIIVFDDSGDRDGIGIEIWHNNRLIIEIFRNDLVKTREVSIYEKNVPLAVVEAAIQEFRRKIGWEYLI